MAATRKLTVEILGDAKGALGAFGSVNKGLGGLGQDFVNFGKKVALGFAAFTAGAVVLGRDFVNAASDLNESISKTEVVFGDAAKAVIDFSKTTASAMGQSQRSSLAAASNFGIFGKSAGLAGEDLSNFTIDLVTLASDLASFNNTTPEEAIEALGAALRGEAEPMRKYGVLLDDASLRQKALEMGIYDGNGALTSQQKILAANALIFEKTSDAQGDFARTSDGVANSSRTLAARFDDLKTKIGTFLLPIALKIVEAFGWLAEKVEDLANKYLPKLRDIFDDVREKIEPVVEALRDELQPIFEKIVNWMRENTGTVKVFLGVITGAAVIAGILALAAAVTALFSPIILIIGAIALIAAAFYYAYTEIEGFREVVDGIIAFFRDEVAPKIAEAYDKIKEKIQEFSDWFDENSETFKTIWNNIKIAFETGAAVVSAIWGKFGGTITASLQSTVGTIFSIVQNLFGVLSGIFQIISGVLSGDWGMMWDGIKQTTSSAISIVGNLISLGFMPIKLAFEGIKIAAIAVFTFIFNFVKSMLSGTINFFVGAINRLIGLINSAIRAYNKIPLAPDIPTIPSIPQVKLAKGGIVTDATVALVGEAGPEAVVPLSGPYMPDFLKESSGGAQVTTINIQVDAGLVSSPDQVGQQIIEAIRRAERRSGQVFAAA